MASKYDEFWRERTDALTSLIAEAAAGGVASVDLGTIRPLGDRASWAGTATVRGPALVRSSMAHMTSLGKVAGGSGLCTPWPEATFVFSMNAVGILAVRQLRAAPSSARRGGGPRVVIGEPPLEGTAAIGIQPMDPTEACGRIHSMLLGSRGTRARARCPSSMGCTSSSSSARTRRTAILGSLGSGTTRTRRAGSSADSMTFTLAPGTVLSYGEQSLPETHALRNTGNDEILIVTAELL